MAEMFESDVQPSRTYAIEPLVTVRIGALVRPLTSVRSNVYRHVALVDALTARRTLCEARSGVDGKVPSENA